MPVSSKNAIVLEDVVLVQNVNPRPFRVTFYKDNEENQKAQKVGLATNTLVGILQTRDNSQGNDISLTKQQIADYMADLEPAPDEELVIVALVIGKQKCSGGQAEGSRQHTVKLSMKSFKQ